MLQAFIPLSAFAFFYVVELGVVYEVGFVECYDEVFVEAEGDNALR